MKALPSYYTSTTIFDVLEAQGRSQAWLARQTGVSQVLLSMMKTGQRRISKTFAERASAALGIPESALFFGLELTDVSTSSSHREVVTR